MNYNLIISGTEEFCKVVIYRDFQFFCFLLNLIPELLCGSFHLLLSHLVWCLHNWDTLEASVNINVQPGNYVMRMPVPLVVIVPIVFVYMVAIIMAKTVMPSTVLMAVMNCFLSVNVAMIMSVM